MSLLAVEETDVTDAEPTELLFLFLTDDFWTLRTNETNRYEHQFLATQILKNQDLIKDILLILTDVHFTDFSIVLMWIK